MKPLFALIFSVLIVPVYADQYVSLPIQYSEVPMSEAITVYTTYPVDVPLSYSDSDSTIVTVLSVDDPIVEEGISFPPPESLPYTVAKPAEKPIFVPQPIGPLLPLQERSPIVEEAAVTVRGQTETMDNLKEILAQPLPPALGAVDAGTIDPKLTEGLASPDLNAGDLSEDLVYDDSGVGTSVGTTRSAAMSDPLGYGVLLAAMVIATIGLIYMAFVAYDYRQRWMQSLTTQNDRYLGSGLYDMEPEDSYNMRSWELGAKS